MTSRARFVSILVVGLVLLALLVALPIVFWPKSAESSGCRVRVLTSAADGPVDAPLYLENAETRERYPLAPLEGGEEGEMFAAGAPSGSYVVRAEDGWGMLWIGRQLPYLSSVSRTATEIPMGRGRTVYVGARDFDRARVGGEWIVERETADGVRVRVDTQLEPALYELVAIRFEPEDWGGRVVLHGRMDDGTLCRPFPYDLGVDPENRPKLAFVSPAPLRQFVVHVVPVERGTSVDEVEVRLEPLGSALEQRFRAEAKSAVAGFAAVPDLEAPIRISLAADEAGAFEVPYAEWTRVGSAYVLFGATRRVELSGAVAGVDLVQVRLEDSKAYGRLRLEREGERLFAYAPLGPQHWLVRAGDAWSAFDVDLDAASTSIDVPEAEEGATVRGRVLDPRRGADRPVGYGHRVIFFRREGSVEALGEALDLAIDAQGGYEAHLPVGRYAIRVLRPEGALVDVGTAELGSGVTQSRTIELPR